jgi:hypothetical protein
MDFQPNVPFATSRIFFPDRINKATHSHYHAVTMETTGHPETSCPRETSLSSYSSILQDQLLALNWLNATEESSSKSISA